MPYNKKNKTVKRRHRKSQKGGWLAHLTKSPIKSKTKPVRYSHKRSSTSKHTASV